MDIVVEPIENDNPRSAWEEIKTKPTEWPNIDMARYFEIDSIMVEETNTNIQ